MFLVAGAVLVGVARDRYRFRVVDVELLASDDRGRCPAEHRVRVRILTAGGNGEVALRVWADEEPDVPVEQLTIASDASGTRAELSTTVTVRRHGVSTAFVTSKSSNHATDWPSYAASCEGSRS
jgi:hypothetical protein